jgi:hypothetical protein
MCLVGITQSLLRQLIREDLLLIFCCYDSFMQNPAPTVIITSPDVTTANSYTLAAIRLNASANDADGTIRKIEFYNGTTLLSTQKYGLYSWE